jgi:hypothetical protein
MVCDATTAVVFDVPLFTRHVASHERIMSTRSKCVKHLLLAQHIYGRKPQRAVPSSSIAYMQQREHSPIFLTRAPVKSTPQKHSKKVANDNKYSEDK